MTVFSCVRITPAEASADIPVADKLKPVDPLEPQVSVLDLGVTRGDGIFEVLGVVNGRAQSVDAHLRRLANSAAMIELPPLDIPAFRAAIDKVVELSEPVPEMSVKIVVTRGVADGNPLAVTAWALGFVNEDDFVAERAEGIKVVLLSRGYPHDIVAKAPWLLAGAKTLSYAVNKAVIREAHRRGADDVIFTSTDGYILEGPGASLIAKYGNKIWTPSIAQGILQGTTQAAAFDYFAEAGFVTGEVLLPIEKLAEADALWLTSSGRMLVPITAVDGVDIFVDRELTDRANAALLARVE